MLELALFSSWLNGITTHNYVVIAVMEILAAVGFLALLLSTFGGHRALAAVGPSGAPEDIADSPAISRRSESGSESEGAADLRHTAAIDA